jgi:hypothetical protein
MRAMNGQEKQRLIPDISAKTFHLNYNPSNISVVNHDFDNESYNSSDTESKHSKIDIEVDLNSLNESFDSEEIIYDETYKPSLIIDVIERRLNKGIKYKDSELEKENKHELVQINKKNNKETKVKFRKEFIINNDLSYSKKKHDSDKSQFRSIFPLKSEKCNTKTTLSSLKTTNATNTAYSTSELMNDKEVKIELFYVEDIVNTKKSKESKEALESF